MTANASDAVADSLRSARRAAGRAAAALVESGMLVGLGTGDSASQFIHALAERVRGGLAGIRCVATSRRSAQLGRELGLHLLDLDEVAPPIDLTVDGADEIDGELQLIKGAGGALLHEKLVAHSSRRLVIVADASKQVRQIGEKRLLPVEVVAFGMRHTLARLQTLPELGEAQPRAGERSGELYLTDGGNRIIDVQVRPGSEARALHACLKALCGVVETGLFCDEAERALIGHPDGSVETLTRPL